MRIAFFGLPIAALLLARDGHDVVYAGTCRKGAIGTRRLVRTLGAARVHVKPDLAKDAVVRRVRDARPDLVVSWFWVTKIPARVVAIAKMGGFGVHPSLLPRHRGPDPYFWAIDAGDRETGVTAHRLAPEYDTGAILGRRALAIDPSWNAWTLAKRLDRPSLALLRETARAFASGAPPLEEAQDEAAATLAPEPDDDALAIAWSWPTDRIARRVRAASPWPGAVTWLGGDDAEPIVVVRVAPVRRAETPHALAPGEAIVQDGVACVRTGDGALRILEGRAADDSPLSAVDLAARVSAGLGKGGTVL
jgi:methionyl-tRNA formyltransferase